MPLPGVASARFERSPSSANTFDELSAWPTRSRGTSTTWNTTPLTDGDYDLRVVTTGDEGLTHASAIVTVTVDNTAPVVSLDTVNGAPATFPYSSMVDVASLGGACVTGDSTVTVTIVDTATQPENSTCTAGAWSSTLTTTITTPTVYTVTTTQTDGAGRDAGTSGGDSLTIEPPVVFVATSGNGGSASNNGTKADPIDSISAAISLAQSRGWTHVNVGQGTFDEGTTVSRSSTTS